MSEIVHRARAAVSTGADFKPSVRPSRPFITKKEAIRVAAPLTLLATTAISCGAQPGTAEVTPIALETPKPLSDLIAEQSQAGIPFQGYNTGESRKSDDFIQAQTSTYGEFKGSTAMIGLDANNSQIMSEMFAFEKGVFVVFYNAEGEAVSEMSPVTINYGYDNKNNLSMIYKADVGDGDGGENITPFLVLTSNTKINNLDSQILTKAQAGDQETLAALAQYFDDPGEIIALSYSNPQTHQQIDIDSQSLDWGDKINNVLQALNPFAVNPVHAAPANTPTPEATATTPAPAINESVKTAIGEEEYNEILTGEVKGKDYITGKDSNWTVETSSVKATGYNDSVFSHIVTGEATDASGKKFTVIWNEEGNYWFKSENINTDLNATERTDFGEQLQGMVESRDLYRMLLTQIDTTFPENTETPRFWMVPRAASIPMNEFFYQLDMSRADFSDDILTQNKDKETYMDIRRGTFTKGNEPYKYAAMIDGIATDLKNSQGESIDDREFSVIPMIVQNSDGKSMIWFGGLDAIQRDDILFSSNSVDSFGNNGIQRFFINQWNRMSLVVPPADEAYWNNYGKAGGNNGGIHFRGDVNFANDAIITMQDEPGTFFSLLSESMQQRLDDNLTEIKNNGWGVSKAVPFEGNGLPQNVIDYLSNHIFETYYNDYGSK